MDLAHKVSDRAMMFKRSLRLIFILQTHTSVASLEEKDILLAVFYTFHRLHLGLLREK